MRSPRVAPTAALLAIVALGFALRAVPVFGNPWPVGDGGLFYTMVGELRANHLALPVFTAYNHEAIPFAYPPLALELAAVLESLTGLARSDVFRFVPLTFSVLCIPAVYLIARELQADAQSMRADMQSGPAAGQPGRPDDPPDLGPWRAFFATLVYATFPLGWEWLTLGSGLTRSVGMCFALLATWQGLVLLRRGGLGAGIATAVLAGLAVLSHPEAGVFVALALGTRLLVQRSWRNLRNLVLAAAGSALVIAPWVVDVVRLHGLAPFEAAGGGVGHDPVASVVVYAFGFVLVGAPPLAATLDLLGQVHTLLNRRPYLVLWRLAVCFLDVRFALVAAVVPLSLLAADGLFDVLLPALRAVVQVRRAPHAEAWLVGVASAGLVVVGLMTPSVFLAPHVALAAPDRAAMAWVRATQPADRRFLVLATATWGSDDLSEWFPALSDRATLDTSQGLEWVAPRIRNAEIAAETQLRTCQPANLLCLRQWLAVHGGPSPAIYVPANGSAYAGSSDSSAPIRRQLLASSAFQVLYDGPGAVVLAPAAGS
ncbi:MAG: ArnT family glycosyltransferase [Candidatus Limnocylindrales bacterium]